MKTAILSIIILFQCLISESATKVTIVQDDNFDSVLTTHENSKLLLVFYSENCPHCHDFLPQFESFSEKYKQKADYGKVDAQEESKLAGQFGIRFVPALDLIIGEKYYEFGEAERNEQNLLNFIENPEQFSQGKDLSNKNGLLPLLSGKSKMKQQKKVLLCK